MLLTPVWAMELVAVKPLKCKDMNLPIVLLNATAVSTTMIEVTAGNSAAGILITISASQTAVDTAVSHIARATNSHNAKNTIGIKATAKARAMVRTRAMVCSDSETILAVKPNPANMDTSLRARATVMRPDVSVAMPVI